MALVRRRPGHPGRSVPGSSASPSTSSPGRPTSRSCGRGSSAPSRLPGCCPPSSGPLVAGVVTASVSWRLGLPRAAAADRRRAGAGAPRAAPPGSARERWVVPARARRWWAGAGRGSASGPSSTPVSGWTCSPGSASPCLGLGAAGRRAAPVAARRVCCGRHGRACPRWSPPAGCWPARSSAWMPCCPWRSATCTVTARPPPGCGSPPVRWAGRRRPSCRAAVPRPRGYGCCGRGLPPAGRRPGRDRGASRCPESAAGRPT